MKVKELIKTLEELVKYHPESEEYEVIMASDAEGNSYSPLSGTYFAAISNGPWRGDVVGSDDDEDCNINAICLSPTN